MSFRRNTNRHDFWVDICAEYSDLVASLPRCIFESEKHFRNFATRGTARDGEGVVIVSLANLTDEQINGLWDFIQNGAQFDMDASLFDAFNAEFRNRFSSS